MSNEATLQVSMDAEHGEQVEKLYQSLGTSFAEAVRMFARQSIQENAMPFVLHVPQRPEGPRIGVAKGRFAAPAEINRYDDEIREMFEGME